jgi:carbon monoxide dehydrogenase subunit G
VNLHGEQLILAPHHRVWDALNDPQILAKCIPGCEEMNKLSDTESELRLMARIGPVRARFSGRIRMSDIVAPTSCTLAFEGSGGAAGTANGQSKVTLESEGDSTRLQYSVNAALGGKLGQIGGRLVEASAKKLADDFFRAFTELLAPQALAAEPRETGATAAPGAAPTAARIALPSLGTGWLGELQRFFWLALGCGIGFMAARLLGC